MSARTIPEATPVLDQDEAMDLIADRICGASRQVRMDAWCEGKTLTVLLKDEEPMQFVKFRFLRVTDKPSNADLRGEPE